MVLSRLLRTETTRYNFSLKKERYVLQGDTLSFFQKAKPYRKAKTLKTQYTALVKIKKDRLDMMEKSVQSCHQTIKIIKEKIEASYDELRTMDIPTNGNFSLFRQMQLLKHRVQDEIQFNKHNLVVAENALIKAMQQLKTANIEHEKFKYLETNEIEKTLKVQRRKEAKELDEVALMAFNRKD